MLSEFFRHATRPPVLVVMEGLEWWVGWGSLAVFGSVFHRPAFEIIPVAIGVGSYYFVKQRREKQVYALSANDRLKYNRWKKFRRVQKMFKDGGIHKAVPRPVLLRLESAARTWHEAREALLPWVDADPAAYEEALATLDVLMMAAVAGAEPVVRRDDQRNSDVRRWEEDEDLMLRITTRIDAEEAKMQAWLTSSARVEDLSQASLRERLERARQERNAAEAELDAML
jgi:hypothetical protein